MKTKSMEIQIIPTLNVKSQDEFVHQLRSVEDLVDRIQIDIADGKFTPWENWHDPEIILQMNTRLSYELHLMVEQPRKEISKWGKIENISRIIIHAESQYPAVETGAHNVLLDTMPTFFAYGADVSVALSPNTPLDVVTPLMQHLYSVTILGVHPGSSGQKFERSVLEKIEKLRALHPTINIEVDGGVNEESIPEIVRAGANILCVGSAIFERGDPKQNIVRLKEIAENANL